MDDTAAEVFTVSTETTAKVLYQRRMRMVRELGAVSSTDAGGRRRRAGRCWRCWSRPGRRGTFAVAFLREDGHPVVKVGGVLQLAGAPAWMWWMVYLACYVSGGWEPALAGLRALRAGSLDVDLLMIVAAIGAAAIGRVFDGALLIVIFASSGALEAWATHRTADSVRALLQLAPERAHSAVPGGR